MHKSMRQTVFLALAALVFVTTAEAGKREREREEKEARVVAEKAWTSPEIPKAPRAPVQPKPPPAKATGKPIMTWDVESNRFHAKEPDAYQDALVVARAELLSKLHEIKPDSDVELESSLLESMVRGKEVLPTTLENEGEKITVVKVKLNMGMTQSQKDDLLRQMRLSQAWHRQLGLGKGLLGVLAVLAALAGYFRLEACTKGYYTGWIKAGVVLFLLVLAVGFILVS